MTDDPFRYCVYCDADTYIEDSNVVDHAEDCPSSTGVFPVRDEDLGEKCPCCGYQHGLMCGRCETPLAVDDRYMLVEVAEGITGLVGPAGASVQELVCVGCAAQAALGD